MMGKCQVVGSASQEDGTETRQSKDSECTDTGGGEPHQEVKMKMRAEKMVCGVRVVPNTNFTNFH